MAHALSNLFVAPVDANAGAGAGNMYHAAKLITADAPAVVEAAGYLNASVKRLPKGTRIDAVMTINGTPVTKTYVVTANNGTAVTIAAQTVA